MMNLAFYGEGSSYQCFPFYVYDEDGSNRRENITDWSLQQFREKYGVESEREISKMDIFHYIYGMLHSPEYRKRFELNLKRELPRIPFLRDFWAYADAGKALADLHLNYENQPEYYLERIENKDKPFTLYVDKMYLYKDKGIIKYNDFLTLAGVPYEAYDYKLGNRSALEWVIDQYRVKTDKRSGIKNDPNRAKEPDYILRLIGKVITVSLETMKLVGSLPEFEVLE